MAVAVASVAEADAADACLAAECRGWAAEEGDESGSQGAEASLVLVWTVA